MTRKVVGGIAAGAFALGILTGSAGTIVVRDATMPGADFAGMGGHMGGDAMGSMMSMMSGSMMGPNASSMPMDPADHDTHHVSPSPDAPR